MLASRLANITLALAGVLLLAFDPAHAATPTPAPHLSCRDDVIPDCLIPSTGSGVEYSCSQLNGHTFNTNGEYILINGDTIDAHNTGCTITGLVINANNVRIRGKSGRVILTPSASPHAAGIQINGDGVRIERVSVEGFSIGIQVTDTRQNTRLSTLSVMDNSYGMKLATTPASITSRPRATARTAFSWSPPPGDLSRSTEATPMTTLARASTSSRRR